MKSSSQNIIAVVWDFDKTLIPYYMQKPLFVEYGVNEEKFWNEEVNKLPELYKNLGVSLSPDTAYLNHILGYVREGIFKNLTNAKLRELGSQLEFFPGMPEFFEESKKLLNNKEEYKKFDLKLEHYIVSTGLTEMIRGSKISPYVDGIWGCEFIEDFFVLKEGHLERQSQGQISSIAYQIDNTTKTRALFEINKGVNVHPEDINVNQMMPEEVRRVPFENMIYIADGPSDVPAFSVMKKNGGKTFAVFNKSVPQSFKQAQVLFKEGRVDNCFEADYRKDTHAYLWLTNEISDIADKIITKKKSQLRQGKESVPVHFN